MYYFAYGSNLSHAQMKRRCPSSKFIEGATLNSYKKIFDGESEIWQSCTANIIPDPDSKAYGAVYEVSDRDLKNLDWLEASEEYLSETVPVQLMSGETVQAKLYRSRSYNIGVPGEKYLTAMKDGIIDCGLVAYKDYVIPIAVKQ